MEPSRVASHEVEGAVAVSEGDGPGAEDRRASPFTWQGSMRRSLDLHNAAALAWTDPPGEPHEPGES